MSVEFFPSQEGEIYWSFSPEDGVDVKHDPKGPALQTIHDFLGLTPQVILEGPVQNLPNLKEIVTFGSESKRELLPNQRLARSMLDLEQALTTLRQYEPPLENREVLRSRWTQIDGVSGEITTMKFYCGKAGSDFGTFLSCRINPDIDTNPTNGSYWHLTLPSNHYLIKTLRWGTPHEPVFLRVNRIYILRSGRIKVKNGSRMVVWRRDVWIFGKLAILLITPSPEAYFSQIWLCTDHFMIGMQAV